MAGNTKKSKKVTPEAKASDKQTPTVTKTPDGTIELRLNISWKDIELVWKQVVEEMAKNTTLPGFRTGKAPKKLIEEKLDESRVRDEVIKLLLPKTYTKIINDNNIRPIMDPRIHIDGELTKGKDWQFHAFTCETPSIDLSSYKDEVKKITSKTKIVVPGKEPEQPKLDEIIKAMLDSIKITIPAILIEREADRLLAQTLDEIKRLGMSLDQYLSSTGRKAEDLRAEYANKAQNDLKLEFALQKIAETEKITVEEAEIEKTISNAKPEEKANLEANKYVLASILRQQKTLDFLKSL